jgi:MoaA/NifB/PqqE/SkfB family radical SAM enzyme
VAASVKSRVKRFLRPYYFRTVSAARLARIKHGPLPGPANLLLDPTYHCNLACISCKCPQIASRFPRDQELTLDEYKRLFAEFRALGGKNVSIYGGEPLLAKFLVASLRAAKDAGLTTSIATNGLLLNEERLGALVATGLDLLSISVDGVGETYDRSAGRPRFEQLKANLQTLARLRAERHPKLRTCIHATVMRQNVSHLVEILDFAHEVSIPTVSFQYVSRVTAETDEKTQATLGVKFLQAWNHWDIGDDVLVTAEELPTLAAQVKELKRLAVELKVDISIDPALDSRSNARNLTTGRFGNNLPCTLPWDSLYVGPLGDLAPCSMLTHYPVANVREVSLADFWVGNAGLANLRRALLSRRYLPICANCCSHTSMMA